MHRDSDCSAFTRAWGCGRPKVEPLRGSLFPCRVTPQRRLRWSSAATAGLIEVYGLRPMGMMVAFDSERQGAAGGGSFAPTVELRAGTKAELLNWTAPRCHGSAKALRTRGLRAERGCRGSAKALRAGELRGGADVGCNKMRGICYETGSKESKCGF
jgi:hypothetical protein